MAARELGTALVSLGSKTMIAIVKTTSPIMIINGVPCRNVIAPSVPNVLKLPS